MRRSLAPFSGPELLVHTRSLADFITTTFGFRFSVHTGLGGPERLANVSVRDVFQTENGSQCLDVSLSKWRGGSRVCTASHPPSEEF